MSACCFYTGSTNYVFFIHSLLHDLGDDEFNAGKPPYFSTLCTVYRLHDLGQGHDESCRSRTPNQVGTAELRPGGTEVISDSLWSKCTLEMDTFDAFL